MVSNLRLMWTSDTHRRTNLSIGYSCIVNMAMKPTKSRLKGEPPCFPAADSHLLATGDSGRKAGKDWQGRGQGGSESLLSPPPCQWRPSETTTLSEGMGGREGVFPVTCLLRDKCVL